MGLLVEHKLALVSLAIAVGLFHIGSADAASYKNLKSKGYKTGSLSKSKSGAPGWVVRNGNERYFCRSRAFGAIVDSKTMFLFSSSGRPIKALRMGNGENYPTWSDYKSGRLEARYIGRCSKIR